jgi:hypothetical protein
MAIPRTGIGVFMALGFMEGIGPPGELRSIVLAGTEHAASGPKTRQRLIVGAGKHGLGVGGQAVFVGLVIRRARVIRQDVPARLSVKQKERSRQVNGRAHLTSAQEVSRLQARQVT